MGGTAAAFAVGPALIGSLATANKVLDKLTPEAPGLLPPPPAPESDPSAQAERDEAARKERERRALSGRASTVLTSGLGDTSTPQLGSAVLLGQ